jgi:hypothetical protein
VTVRVSAASRVVLAHDKIGLELLVVDGSFAGWPGWVTFARISFHEKKKSLHID